MKAIIMAGGEGVRLRPITAKIPKPMVNIAGKPAIEHIIKLLKSNSITEMCLTLRYLPQVITDFLGDGKELGVMLESKTETIPLGTAGSVRACEDFLNGEDFIVISGDGIYDFDLRACIEKHYKSGSEISVVLCSRKKPLEYGVVVTDKDGHITKFVEKPTWDMVYSNSVNTGIYIMSNKILQQIPKGKPYDFGRDMFPKLLREGTQMLGIVADGYWCDIGSSEAYHKCCMDILDGRVKIQQGGKMISGGVWCKTDISNTGAVIIPPVTIGRGVTIGKNARIGPRVMLSDNSCICNGAIVRESVVDGAVIHDNASITGAVIQHGASIGRGTVIEEGVVIGENTIIGSGSLVGANVKIWPDREIPCGTRLTENVVSGMAKEKVKLSGNGSIIGEYGEAITPELCVALGGALAGFGSTAVASAADDTAMILADALDCGIRAAGGKVIRLDCDFEALTEFSGVNMGADSSVFIGSNDTGCILSFYDKLGRHISGEKQRKLNLAARGENIRKTAMKAGSTIITAGLSEIYIQNAVMSAGESGSGIKISTPGKGSENRTLRQVLALLECGASDNGGTVQMIIEKGGYGLKGIDERGQSFDSNEIFAVAAYIELAEGGKTVTIETEQPSVVQELCRSMNKRYLAASDEKGFSKLLFRKQRFMRDGIFAAAKVAAYLGRSGMQLWQLRRKIPRFVTMTREIELPSGRAAAMRRFSESDGRYTASFGRGINFRNEKGSVLVTPCFDREAIRIISGSTRAEFARELCEEFEKRAKER